MIVRTGLTGPFPRPEPLVAATRDLDRGRTTAELVEEVFATTEAEVVALEERLGLDWVTGGYLRWPDLFRPFAETWEGFTVGPLTRWFETNTFYRQPILHAPPTRAAGAILARLPPAARAGPARAGVLLPGPFTFAGLLDNRSGETPEALVHRLGRLLAEEVRELGASGFATFQFAEPLLVHRPPERALAEAVVAAYRSVHAAAGSATTLVWTYGASALPVFPLLDRLPVSGVGVDLAETDWESIPATPERRGLGLGVIDPRTTLVEDPAEVTRIARALNERRRPTAVYLGPGGPLDLLPWAAAMRKLHLLAAARQGLADGDGGRR
jgi:5-methyltetrahydropteroyltriglutamate--homocysteine methyltransferase